MRAIGSGAPERMAISFDEVVDAARHLPGIEVGTSYNTPALKVKGKFMGRLRSEAEGALVLRCELFDREMLMQADAETFFITEHYKDYPAVLINLTQLRRAALPQLLEAAWRMVAPAKLIAAFDAQPAGSTPASMPRTKAKAKAKTKPKPKVKAKAKRVATKQARQRRNP